MRALGPATGLRSSDACDLASWPGKGEGWFCAFSVEVGICVLYAIENFNIFSVIILFMQSSNMRN